MYKKKSKKILITGGAGYIGAHLTEKLIQKGHRVLVVDLLKIQGGIPFVNKKCKFIKGDITNKRVVEKIKRWCPEIIFHLAAQSAVEPAYQNPKSDILTNAYGTFLICNLAKKLKVKILVYTSSVAVYGNSNKKLLEENSIIAPDSLYGVSKHSGEMFVHQILKKSKTKTIIFRLFNTYGPGDNLNNQKKGMVSIYSSYVWKKKPILVKGSLKRFRDFVYIDDCVEVLAKSITVKLKNKNEIFNLTTGENLTVKTLLRKILEASNNPKNYPIRILEETKGDSFGFHASGKKLRKFFKFKPKYKINNGLKKYFNWINKISSKKDLSSFHPLKIKN
ncbi:MAG: hypothetical protein CMI79_02365 [Candidatus Pelagibacter sp.]|nr:hypothetical protein [Candidatus Pelagibacter sp.]|tara:strand:+ start:5425 stop:6426 length:1002 start_codon:yes stop_codon:yes gene_type:complete